jgi:hypothetical protein
MCIANVHYWGYFPRQWRPWPGESVRQDIIFPQSLGVEAVATPRGTKPRPLPKEKYGKPKRVADRTVEIEILEGAPVETIQTPAPFEYWPDREQNLPGLDTEPKGPSLQ